MLDRSSASRNFLDTESDCGRHHTGQKRILGIVFEVPAAERIPVNIHARRQPQRHVKQFHLTADHLTDFLQKTDIPCLCQKRTNRDCGTVLIVGCAFHFLRIGKEAALKGLEEPAFFDHTVHYLIRLMEP